MISWACARPLSLAWQTIGPHLHAQLLPTLRPRTPPSSHSNSFNRIVNPSDGSGVNLTREKPDTYRQIWPRCRLDWLVTIRHMDRVMGSGGKYQPLNGV